jgi:hypothetical protein
MLLSLVPVDRFCKTDTETDLTTLHYMTIIEPLTVSSKEALSLDSKQFTNNSNNKVIEEKQPTIFYYSENISLPQFYYTKKYKVQFESLSNEVLEFFSEPKSVTKELCIIKFILVTLVV